MTDIYKAIEARAVPKVPYKKKPKPKQTPPEHKYCRNCGQETGTEAWRHAESRLIKFEHGGSTMGGKLPDDQTAWLCMDCDSKLSQPLPKAASQKQLREHAREWRRLIKLSH